jgi:cathepsin A (carboxypeptidase C)
MRFAPTALLASAASASLLGGHHRDAAQRVLSGGAEAVRPLADALASGGPMKSLQDVLRSMTEETRALWEELQLLAPGIFDKLTFLSYPKPHIKRPFAQWDHVVRGADVQAVWVDGNEGKHREVDGPLDTYNLRVKAVDPSKLGVDDVKQYTGYLDDEANDKHLFYCKPLATTLHPPFILTFASLRVL